MSKRVLVLVEGQTEERFVKQVLAPEFAPGGVYIVPTILTTKVVKSGPNFKGGVVSFGKFEADLRRLLGGAGSDALVTTIADYYRLPNDFPGMATRPAPSTPVARVCHVEAAIADYFKDGRLLPFLSLHEFEAWLFSCPKTLPHVMAQPSCAASFAKACDSVPTPEQINERPRHNPSSLIMEIFSGYRKVLHGPTAITRMGIKAVRDKCPHFHAWINQLEKFATE